jgi:Kef-type K+ transport system membrane component KefB
MNGVMSLTAEEVAQMLAAIGLLLVSAHVVGHLFEHVRQPRVIGEIVGGLLLGPTVLLGLFPGGIGWIFPPTGPIPSILAAFYQLGLLLLMYCSGAEMRALFARGERKTVVAITLGGILVPFGAGLLLITVISTGSLRGAAGSSASFALVFGIAIAVTSIPVISKILVDLGIIGTSFARVVLSAAVIEDVVLYVALAVALGIAQADQGMLFGLPAALHVSSGVGAVVYHVLAEVAFLVIAIALGPPLFRRTLGSRYNLLKRSNPIAFQLAFMLALSGVCVILGVVPLFGAFVAGIVAGTATGEGAIRARESIKRFSFAFFVPMYFALVGFQLDLVHSFPTLFFLEFLVVATAVKALSVYASARIVRETHSASVNLAVAMNARGGPGIVLASVALDAGIISRSFYASLVMLAVTTSLFAGAWLGRVVRHRLPLRGSEVADLPDPKSREGPAGVEITSPSDRAKMPIDDAPID